jgi:hypothetical protein
MKPMAPQIILAHLQFGLFFFGEMPNCTNVLASSANMSMLIFRGDNWRMKQCKLARFITIVSIPVEIDFRGVILCQNAACETVDGVFVRFFYIEHCLLVYRQGRG